MARDFDKVFATVGGRFWIVSENDLIYCPAPFIHQRAEGDAARFERLLRHRRDEMRADGERIRTRQADHAQTTAAGRSRQRDDRIVGVEQGIGGRQNRRVSVILVLGGVDDGMAPRHDTLRSCPNLGIIAQSEVQTRLSRELIG